MSAPARPDSAGLHTAEVDGVPVLWSPVPGPFRARLLLRAGLTDEPLTRSGWTHLVEHLVLEAAGVQVHSGNGSVDVRTTTLDLWGDPDEVVEQLATVCAALADLPVARLEDEKRVLAVEAQRRRPGLLDLALRERFGLDGPGSRNRPEIGVHGADPEGLRAHARRVGARDGACLWLSAEPPAGLALPLPSGDGTAPAGAAQVRLPPGPWVRPCRSDPALSLWMPRTAPSLAIAAVLGDRLRRRLRRELALSYTVEVHVEDLGVDGVHLLATADGPDSGAAQVCAELVSVVEDLAGGVVQPEEITALRRQLAQGDPGQAALRRLDEAARAQLHGLPDTGGPERSVDQLEKEGAAALAQAWPDRLLLVPEDDAPVGPWQTRSVWSAGPAGGRLLGRWVDQRHDEQILVSDEGVTAHLGPDQWLTVLWSDVVALQTWEDGLRSVWSGEGRVVHLDPRLLVARPPAGEELAPGAPPLAELVDARVPAALCVPQPPREPLAEEPTPPPAPAEADQPPPRRFRDRPDVVAARAGVLLVLMVFAAILTSLLIGGVVYRAVGAVGLGLVGPLFFAALLTLDSRRRKRKA